MPKLKNRAGRAPCINSPVPVPNGPHRQTNKHDYQYHIETVDDVANQIKSMYSPAADLLGRENYQMCSEIYQRDLIKPCPSLNCRSAIQQGARRGVGGGNDRERRNPTQKMARSYQRHGRGRGGHDRERHDPNKGTTQMARPKGHDREGTTNCCE